MDELSRREKNEAVAAKREYIFKMRADASARPVGSPRPAFFRWPYGGSDVCVCGSWDDWKAHHPLSWDQVL